MRLAYLLLLPLLNGCAVQSALVDVEEPRGGFVITRPPIRIAYRGDVSKVSQDFAIRVLKQVQTDKYKNYKFNENANFRLNSVDAKSDSANINLHEATTTPRESEPPVEEEDSNASY